MVVTTSAASASGASVWKRKACASKCWKAPTDAPACTRVTELLAREKYLSLMIEAGSRVNWTALESGVADKIFFYYAPKILGGTQSLPVAGGAGRRRRADAIQFHDVKLHSITADEFAVEAWSRKG